MYYEFDRTNRKEWKYCYTGQELLESANKLLREYTENERESRVELAALISNPAVGANSSSISDKRKKVEEYARLAEELWVYVKEFQRKPEREYHLSLGDVVFFFG